MFHLVPFSPLSFSLWVCVCVCVAFSLHGHEVSFQPVVLMFYFNPIILTAFTWGSVSVSISLSLHTKNTWYWSSKFVTFTTYFVLLVGWLSSHWIGVHIFHTFHRWLQIWEWLWTGSWQPVSCRWAVCTAIPLCLGSCVCQAPVWLSVSAGLIWAPADHSYLFKAHLVKSRRWDGNFSILGRWECWAYSWGCRRFLAPGQGVMVRIHAQGPD